MIFYWKNIVIVWVILIVCWIIPWTFITDNETLLFLVGFFGGLIAANQRVLPWWDIKL